MFKNVTRMALCFFICGAFWGNSFATIIVSGDVTIILPLDPAFPTEYEIEGVTYLMPNEGNKRFFLNVLQGSQKAAVVKKEVNLDIWNPQTYEDTAQDLYCIEDEENAVNSINSFYSTSAGITSSVIDIVTAPALEDVGLLLIPLPGSAFSEEELSVMNSYIDDGGSIFFLGDAFDHPEQNANINQALLGMGSTLSLAEDSGLDILEGGPRYAKGAQMRSSFFTSGIDSLLYGYVSEVKSDSGWLAPIFLTQDGGGIPFVAYEQPPSVPEPSAIALLFISLSALLYPIRKRKK